MRAGNVVKTKIMIPANGFDRKRPIKSGTCGVVIAVNPQGMPLVKFKGQAWPRAFKIEEVEIVKNG